MHKIKQVFGYILLALLIGFSTASAFAQSMLHEEIQTECLRIVPAELSPFLQMQLCSQTKTANSSIECFLVSAPTMEAEVGVELCANAPIQNPSGPNSCFVNVPSKFAGTTTNDQQAAKLCAQAIDLRPVECFKANILKGWTVADSIESCKIR